jgi:hypothetical protein
MQRNLDQDDHPRLNFSIAALSEDMSLLPSTAVLRCYYQGFRFAIGF